MSLDAWIKLICWGETKFSGSTLFFFNLLNLLNWSQHYVSVDMYRFLKIICHWHRKLNIGIFTKFTFGCRICKYCWLIRSGRWFLFFRLKQQLSITWMKRRNYKYIYNAFRRNNNLLQVTRIVWGLRITCIYCIVDSVRINLRKEISEMTPQAAITVILTKWTK